MRILGAGFQQNILNASVVSAWTPLRLPNLKLWLDPSDLSTLFQDAAGTIPVTADGDPVGVWLDRSIDIRLGNELITNGDFSNGLDDWDTPNGGWVASGGAALLNGDGNVQLLEQSGVMELGGWYRIKYYCSSSSSSIVLVGDVGDNLYYDNGDNTLNVQAPTTRIAFKRLGGVITDGVVRSVSVREILGNHAKQSVSTYRPQYKTGESLSWIKYDLTDDIMTATMPAIPTATVAVMTDEGLDIQYPVNIDAGSYDIGPTSALGIEYQRVIVDGELSASDTAKLTAYMNKKGGVV